MMQQTRRVHATFTGQDGLARLITSLFRPMSPRIFATSFAAALLAAPLSYAADPPDLAKQAEPQVGIFSFVQENDLFYNTDRRYTSGVRFSYLTPKNGEPEWLRDLAYEVPMLAWHSDIRVEYALGQNMYTASNKLLRDPPPDDRPYAGWLYGSVGVVARTGQVLDQFLVSVGVVGSASLAHQTQDFIHSIVDSPEAQGWGKQLKNEPTLQFTYQRSWQSPEFKLPAGFGIDATPHAGAAIGNVYDYANMGMMFRFGQNLPIDYGPPRVQPSLPGSGYFEKAPGGFGWYVFAGVDGRAVAHNIFLDGNTFRDSRSVKKENFVGDAQLGLAVVIDGVRLAYTHVLRTREYVGQDASDQFGAFSVSFAF